MPNLLSATESAMSPSNTHESRDERRAVTTQQMTIHAYYSDMKGYDQLRSDLLVRT